jgi:hypothetical protein
MCLRACSPKTMCPKSRQNMKKVASVWSAGHLFVQRDFFTGPHLPPLLLREPALVTVPTGERNTFGKSGRFHT